VKPARSFKNYFGRRVIDSRGLAAVSFDRVVVTDDGNMDIFLDRLFSSGVSTSEVVFVDYPLLGIPSLRM